MTATLPLPISLVQAIRRPGLLAAIAAISTVGIAISLGLPLLALVLEHRGVSPLWIGINTAVAGVASIGVTPFVTPLARKTGTARLAVAAVLVAALSFPLFYFASAFWLWFPLRVVFHGAVTTVFILSEFWINALAPDTRRGAIMGVYAACLSIGFMVGPLIISVVGGTGPAPFVIGSTVLVLAALPLLRARKASPGMQEEPSETFVRFILSAPLATLAGFVFGAVESGALSLLPVYGVRLDLVPADAVLLVSAVAAGNIVLQLPLGLIADRMDRRKLLLICATAGMVGAAAIPFTTVSFPLLLALLFVWGGVMAGMYTVGLIHLGARFSGTDLASANSAFVMLYSLGMLLGPATFGASLSGANPHLFPYTIAALFGLYAAVAVPRLFVEAKARRGS